MKPKRIGDLLDRIGCLAHPCDLDLLLFFYRHPLAYLQRERLADYVGYQLPQVERSLETLMTAGLLQIPRSRRVQLDSTFSREAAAARSADGSRRSCESPRPEKAGWPSFTLSNSAHRLGSGTVASANRSRTFDHYRGR
jgi:hypothetical protein